MNVNERYSNNFDALRVFAAICITLTHSYGLLQFDAQEPLMKLTNQKLNFSFVGLSIFFAVSGYLIAKSAATSKSLLHYCWKRLLRIQPLLIVVCLLSIFVVGPVFTSISLREYFSNFHSYAYLRNVLPFFGIQFDLPNVFANNIGESGINGSLWTLVVEERLYLILGLIFLARKYAAKYFVIVVATLNLFYFFTIFFLKNGVYEYLNTQAFTLALMFVNASAFYFLNIDFSKLLKNKFSIFFLLFFFVAAYFLNQLYIFKVIFIPVLVLLLANIKSVFNRFGKYGDLTYGIYIFSFPVQQMLIAKNVVGQNPMMLFISTILIVIPIAFLSWHIFEKKILLFKDKIS